MFNVRKLSEKRWLWSVLLAVVVAIAVQGCSRSPAAPEAKEKPSVVEQVDGSDLKWVILTEKAAQRIGVQTVLLQELIPQTGASTGSKSNQSEELVKVKEAPLAVPYASVIYDIEGETWLYTNPEPLKFLRQRIVVDHIDGEWALLSEALPANTRIVTTGVAELYGAETGVGK